MAKNYICVLFFVLFIQIEKLAMVNNERKAFKWAISTVYMYIAISKLLLYALINKK